tara:strand:+ start:2113 stop:2346 length:234 start_codon:yes stop_codon:yes gene_type:complete
MSSRTYSFGTMINHTNGVTGNFKGLYVGGAGDVVIDFANASGISFGTVPAGTFMHVAGVRLGSAADGTSATEIITLH